MTKRKLVKHILASMAMFAALTAFSGKAALAAENLTIAEESNPNLIEEIALEDSDTIEKSETILSSAITKDDETAILNMINAYSRMRNSSVEQLENQINDYFISQYSTVRSFYVVEFKSAGNGTLKDRTVYVLMGDDNVKYLNNAVGGFVTPTTVPKTGYAFDYWNRMNEDEEIESDTLGSMPINSATVFYGNFTEDKNGDGIPDRKQAQYTVTFEADQTKGSLSGETVFTVYAPIDGSPAYLNSIHGFTLPTPRPEQGYAFDKWVDANGEIENIDDYTVDANITITAIFATDINHDGIPDYKQNFHNVVFIAGSGGSISGDNMEFSVLAEENGDPAYMANNFYNNYPDLAIPNEGYMFLHWVDHEGTIISTEAYTKYLLHFYPVAGPSVIVAVFTEDKNGDNIPDDEQDFFQVDFVSGMGGTIEGNRTMTYATAGEGKYPALGSQSLGFKVIADNGYTLSYWIDHKGNVYNRDSNWYNDYVIKENTVFVAVFAEDFDENGIPDEEQKSNIPVGNYAAEGTITFHMQGIMDDLNGTYKIQNGNLEAKENELIFTFQAEEIGDFTIKMMVYTDESDILHFSKFEVNGVEYNYGDTYCPFQALSLNGEPSENKISTGEFYMNFVLTYNKL